MLVTHHDNDLKVPTQSLHQDPDRAVIEATSTSGGQKHYTCKGTCQHSCQYINPICSHAWHMHVHMQLLDDNQQEQTHGTDTL
jgi:hypothetical protein